MRTDGSLHNVERNIEFISLYYILSVLAFVTCLSNEPVGDGCEELLQKFAELTANFTKCAVQYARPIYVCQGCVTQYHDVVKLHRKILKLHDESGVACKLELMNVDILQIVEGTFSFVVNMWERASCNKCFEKSRQDPSGYHLNKNTREILQLEKFTTSCFSNNWNETNNNTKVCINCVDDYNALNQFYNDNDGYNGFCMDIVDMMNTTRYTWSIHIGCCSDRRKPQLIFILSAAAVVTLPIIFYLALWYFSSLAFHETITRLYQYINYYFSASVIDFNVISENRWMHRFSSVSISSTNRNDN